MKTVGAYEAKTHLPRLLAEAARGETILITKHGLPVARLVPPQGETSRDAGAALDQWLKIRQTITLGGLSLRELIEEGRR